MKRLEFEAWVSDNYKDLLRAATRVARNREYGDHAQQCLHEAIEDLVAGKAKLPPRGSDAIGWIMRATYLKVMATRTKDLNQDRLRKRFGAQQEVLEADVFVDTTTAEYIRIRRARQARERRARERSAEDESRGQDAERAAILEGQVGDTRWRYQQRRDARLYDARACSSLSDHVRGVSARSLRGIGRSLVHWGIERKADPRDTLTWVQTVKGYGPDIGWTGVSCSTGYSYRKLRFGMGSPHAFDRCGGCSEHAISGRHDKACALKRSAA